ncbi:unnamed protein product [Nesidiocoris tenuis]|uniref:Uncharacterized protein n=1 Tax=Nesidiocoris tenuis TaxID=355587 RepID=A0A6H5GAD4_9HEMI|nr:unnamed protein product [Nesidiocoris tenuis]
MSFVSYPMRIREKGWSLGLRLRNPFQFAIAFTFLQYPPPCQLVEHRIGKSGTRQSSCTNRIYHIVVMIHHTRIEFSTMRLKHPYHAAGSNSNVIYPLPYRKIVMDLVDITIFVSPRKIRGYFLYSGTCQDTYIFLQNQMQDLKKSRTPGASRVLALVSPYRHFGRYGDRQRPHIFILALTPLTWSMVTPFRRPLPIAKLKACAPLSVRVVTPTCLCSRFHDGQKFNHQWQE